jgi:hypothetical protein
MWMAVVLAGWIAFITSRTVAAENSYLQAAMYQQITARSDYRLLSQRDGVSGSSSGSADLSSGVLYLLSTKEDVVAFQNFNPALVKFALVMSYNLFNPWV